MPESLAAKFHDMETDPEDTKEINRLSVPGLSSLMMDENMKLMEDVHTTHSSSEKMEYQSSRSYPSIVIKLLSLSNLVLMIGVLVLVFVKFKETPCHTYQTTLSKQPIWQPPEIWLNKTLFFNRMYGRPPDEENIQAWNEMMPVGRGFVIVKNVSSVPELPKFFPELPEQHALVSVFHQLHCIWATKEAYFNLVNGTPEDTDQLHLSHCWDYLRQTTICNADLTLEWMPDPDNHTSTGWGYQHKCRDFQAVFDWTVENHWEESFGIH